MVGRVGVEPTTSRLSGVRSNHLSYRPILRTEPAMKADGRQVSQLGHATQNSQARSPASLRCVSRDEGT